MPGPCPAGQPTEAAHKKCADRERCTGPGCRYRRPKRVVRLEATETTED
jgi:hypothetical protein